MIFSNLTILFLFLFFLCSKAPPGPPPGPPPGKKRKPPGPPLGPPPELSDSEPEMEEVIGEAAEVNYEIIYSV